MKLIKSALMLVLMAAASNAATINVTAGLPTQGLVVTTDGLARPNQLVAVGNFGGGVFTSFGTPILDTGKINGQFVATGPTSLNGLPVHLFVGSGTTIANSAEFIILSNNGNPLFPADVTGIAATTFAATLSSVLTVVTSQSAQLLPNNTINFVAIPEPSTMLLGALGALGLLRRRR